MEEAAQAYVEIDDLEAAASWLISRCTGAEAGIVTCGAAAGVTLAAAACLAGSDPERMDRLPDVGDFPCFEIIYPTAGPYDYDHAVRLSGAKVVEIDYSAGDALARVEAAIGSRTAAVGYAWYHAVERPAIRDLAEVAHRHGVPLLVDGAMSLPPVENLRKFIAQGADLVAFSGGKHLGGPQASGILCGRKDLVRSAWLQMVDMDVRPGTWSLRPWIEEGWVARPPRHGIGRSMKVGKEAIVGLMAALETYDRRDHAAELAGWRRRADEIASGLASLSVLRVTSLFPSPTGQPFPAVRIETEGMRGLIRALRELRPKILMAEDEVAEDRAYIYPMCLRPQDVPYIVASIRWVVQK
jgi:L-seryl-tRNA(Ser) seleniumtransferase